MEIKRLIKEHSKQVYAHKFDNLDEMDNLSKLIKEKDDLNKPVSVKEIKSIINNLLKHKALGPDRLTG